MDKKIFIISLTVLFLFAGAAQAQTNEFSSPRLLPDSPFYFLKSWTESIGTFFTFRPESKVKRFLNLSERRLTEAIILEERGKMELAEKTLQEYQNNFDSAWGNIEEKAHSENFIAQLLDPLVGYTVREFKRLESISLGNQSIMENIRKNLEALMAVDIEIEDRVNIRLSEGREKMSEIVSEKETDKIMEEMEPESSLDEKTEEPKEEGLLDPIKEKPLAPTEEKPLETVVEPKVEPVGEVIVVEPTIMDCLAFAELDPDKSALCVQDLLETFKANLSECQLSIGTTFIGWEPVLLGLFREYEIKGVENDRCVVQFEVRFFDQEILEIMNWEEVEEMFVKDEVMEKEKAETIVQLLSQEMMCKYGPDERIIDPYVAEMKGCSGFLYEGLKLLGGLLVFQ